MTKYVFWVQGGEVIVEADNIIEATEKAEADGGIVSWGTTWTDPSKPRTGDTFRSLKEQERGDVR